MVDLQYNQANKQRAFLISKKIQKPLLLGLFISR